MATKTPFELRFDTLSFARNHLIEEYSAKASMLNYMDGAERYNLIKELSYPSVDAIFELADRFKSFINDQDTKPKLAPITQRIIEHSGAMLSEESFKRIFPDVPYAQPNLELNGEKPFTVEGYRIFGAYRALENPAAEANTETAPRLFSSPRLEKEIEEMERLREIIKPAIEAKIICLYDAEVKES
jgi:hypothetical protein